MASNWLLATDFEIQKSLLSCVIIAMNAQYSLASSVYIRSNIITKTFTTVSLSELSCYQLMSQNQLSVKNTDELTCPLYNWQDGRLRYPMEFGLPLYVHGFWELEVWWNIIHSLRLSNKLRFALIDIIALSYQHHVLVLKIMEQMLFLSRKIFW